MLDIKKHSLLGIISLILAIIVIILIIIDSIIVITWPIVTTEDLWHTLKDIFDVGRLTVVLFFLTIITTIIGLIAWLIKKDRFGTFSFLVGVIGFFLNWVLLFIALTRLDF